MAREDALRTTAHALDDAQLADLRERLLRGFRGGSVDAETIAQLRSIRLATIERLLTPPDERDLRSGPLSW